MPDKRARPNILLIMSDQHNKHLTGCYGDPIIQTPNLDALAARGVIYDSAYCDFPLCCPARMAFMTGRRPSEIGVIDNGDILASDLPTFAHSLGHAGYDVIHCGRMHFNGPDQRHGFSQRIFPEVGGSAVGDLVDTYTFKRPSFEKSGPGRNHYLLYDKECADTAAHWLRERDTAAAPFCLVVGMVGPHCPFVCPQEEFDNYYNAIPVPENTEGYLNNLHPYVRRFRERSQLDTLTPQEIHRTRAAYYGMIDYDDQLIGQMLTALEDSGQADSTMVIYTSDHGDMAGEHGLWWKMSFYEGSAGIPLIVSWPGHFPQNKRETAPVSLIDLAPTMTALGEAPEIPAVTGKALPGLAADLGTDRDGRVFSELLPTPRMIDFGPSGGPGRMLREGAWKCNYYYKEEPELFNLEEDPQERINRAADPDCADVLERMLAMILTDWDPEALLVHRQAKAPLEKFVRGAPANAWQEGKELWQGPEGYGTVFPVGENSPQRRKGRKE